MASRSRAFTRHDPAGRFSPSVTPQDAEAAERLREALAPVKPSEVVRSDAWYGRMREQNASFAPGFWLVFFALVGIALLVL